MEMYTFLTLLRQKAKAVRSRRSQPKRNFRMEKDKQLSRPTKRNKVRVVSARFTLKEIKLKESCRVIDEGPF